MSNRNRRWVVILVAALAVMAGCTGANGGGDSAGDGGDGGGGDAFDAAEPGAFATGTPMRERAGGGDGDGVEFQAQQFAERQLILTGEIAIEVDDFEAARANLTEATERYGGFVSDTRQEVNRRDNQTWTTGVLVLRVPRGNFTPLFETARTEGELLEADQHSDDVTNQLVDLQARLDNLRAERDQLRELYQRANETEDVLQVQERLSDVQGEIERLEARQQTLQQRVALSTITVRIVEPRPDRVLADQWYDIPLVVAFLESVDGVATTLRAMAVAAAYAAPYLVVFGVPLAVAGYAIRRRDGGRRGGRPPGPGGLSRRLRRRRGGGDAGTGARSGRTDDGGTGDTDGEPESSDEP